MKKLFLVFVILLGVASCGDELIVEQKILLQYPEFSAMTVGQVFDFTVSLNLPANGKEVLTAQSSSKSMLVLPESQVFLKYETSKVFTLFAESPGKTTIRFSMDDLFTDFNIMVFAEPK